MFDEQKEKGRDRTQLAASPLVVIVLGMLHYHRRRRHCLCRHAQIVVCRRAVVLRCPPTAGTGHCCRHCNHRFLCTASLPPLGRTRRHTAATSNDTAPTDAVHFESSLVMHVVGIKVIHARRSPVRAGVVGMRHRHRGDGRRLLKQRGRGRLLGALKLVLVQ